MIGIVGGGISGLLLLHLLRQRGIDAVVLEGSALPGGVMASRVIEGPEGPVTVDLGPQRMRLTPAIAEVLDEISLTPSILRARPGVPFTMYRDGRFHRAPMSVGDGVRTPLISWRGKLRALADLVTPGPAPGETVEAALTRKLGPEIYSRLAGPLLGGLYGSDPAEMEARHTLLPALSRTGQSRSLLLGLARTARLQSVPVISFRGGMGELPSTLARHHQDRIRLGSPVITVEGSAANGFAVHTPDQTIRTTAVVLTLPAPEAAGVLRELAPAAATSLASLRYNPLAVVPMVAPSHLAPPDVGSGFKMTMDDRRAMRGVTAHEALFDRTGLFTAFLGGMGREDLLERDDTEILEIARADFREVTGAEATPLLVHRTRMPAWDRSWAAMDRLQLPEGIHLCAAFAHRPGIAGRLEDARRVADRLAVSGPAAARRVSEA